MNKIKRFIKDSDVQWEEVAPGMRRKVMAYDEALMIVRVSFEKGSIGQLHQHYHSQMTHVESGVFEVQIDGVKQVLQAGDAFYIPPNELHGCICLQEGVLIDVFNPMREEFVSTTNEVVTKQMDKV